MLGEFERITKQESNEKTALILMLGILGEKLSDITDLMKELSSLSSEMLSCLKEGKESLKKDKILPPLTREDYLD